MTKKYGRSVTGLVLSNDGRVTIGREKKRALNAAIHHASLGGLSKRDLQKLSGMLAYVQSVEPDFFEKIQKKYSVELFQHIQKHASLKRAVVEE